MAMLPCDSPSTIRRPARRRLVVVAVAALAAAWALALPTSPSARAESTGAPMTTMDMGATDGLLPPGDWTADQRAFLLDLIDRTEAALPAFADPATLPALGFHDFGIAAPGGYVHYINNGWIDDGRVLDPTHPESLLFRQTYDPVSGQVHSELLAAMFIMPRGTTMDMLPADLAWIPGWHVHPDVCVTDDFVFSGLAGQSGQCASGHPMTAPVMTHVWIVDNACGHRFGMVDVGGLMCDVHMHDPDDPDMTMPGHDTTMPGHDSSMPNDDPGHSITTTTLVPAGDEPATKNPSVAPAATPLAARPAYAG